MNSVFWKLGFFLLCFGVALGNITNDRRERAFSEDPNLIVIGKTLNPNVERLLRKDKGKVNDRPPPPRPCQIAISGDCTQENVDDSHFTKGITSSQTCGLQLMNNDIPVHRITEADQSMHNKPLDISSEEELEESYETGTICITSDSIHMDKVKQTGTIDITRDSIHVEKGKHFTSNDCNLRASKKNKVDGGEILNQELLDKVGLVKACSCSFCLKAASMWIDLTYQDTEGRLASLKKSRSHVSSLEGKISGHDRTAKLDFDLMQHWRSLFLHTEQVLLRETDQLESTLLELQKLGRTARDLEMSSRLDC